MLVTREFLVDKLGLPQTAIEDTITKTSGWTNYHTIVF